jgi:hypothetical protein
MRATQMRAMQVRAMQVRAVDARAGRRSVDVILMGHTR